MEPQVGEIWLDDNGDHNLILQVFFNKDYGTMVAHILTLDSSEYWDNNPFEDFGDGRYFHTRVA